MEVPEHIAEGLSNIRETLHLRWNPLAVLRRPGDIDANGHVVTEAEYEPRWELWDTDADGKEYMVMRVQTVEGEFRPVGEWLVEHIWKIHPARYGGDVHKMVQAQIDDPDTLRELGTQKDIDNLIEAVSQWAAWVAVPKSAAGLSYRGRRILSA